MASPPSPEASDIRRRSRRRLLGAVTLVLLVVVFVPMILDSEPRPARTQPALAIPAREKVEPLPMPTPATVTKAAPPSVSGEVQVPVPAKVVPAAPKLEGFAVQVGAFRDEERLKQARARLEGAKVPHYIERVDASGGAITRLRAGPFPTREAAEAARAKLNDGQVVPLP